MGGGFRSLSREPERIELDELRRILDDGFKPLATKRYLTVDGKSVPELEPIHTLAGGGFFEKALAEYQELYDEHPNDQNLATSLIWCLVKLERYEKALEFNASYASNTSKVRWNAAFAFWKTNHNPEAAAIVDKLSRSSEFKDWAHYYSACIQLLSGVAPPVWTCRALGLEQRSEGIVSDFLDLPGVEIPDFIHVEVSSRTSIAKKTPSAHESEPAGGVEQGSVTPASHAGSALSPEALADLIEHIGENENLSDLDGFDLTELTDLALMYLPVGGEIKPSWFPWSNTGARPSDEQDREEAERLFKTAEAAFSAGDYEGADARLQRAEEAHPNNAFLVNRAMCFALMSKYSRAVELLSHLQQRKPPESTAPAIQSGLRLRAACQVASSLKGDTGGIREAATTLADMAEAMPNNQELALDATQAAVAYFDSAPSDVKAQELVWKAFAVLADQDQRQDAWMIALAFAEMSGDKKPALDRMRRAHAREGRALEFEDPLTAIAAAPRRSIEEQLLRFQVYSYKKIEASQKEIRSWEAQFNPDEPPAQRREALCRTVLILRTKLNEFRSNQKSDERNKLGQELWLTLGRLATDIARQAIAEEHLESAHGLIEAAILLVSRGFDPRLGDKRTQVARHAGALRAEVIAREVAKDGGERRDLETRMDSSLRWYRPLPHAERPGLITLAKLLWLRYRQREGELPDSILIEGMKDILSRRFPSFVFESQRDDIRVVRSRFLTAKDRPNITKEESEALSELDMLISPNQEQLEDAGVPPREPEPKGPTLPLQDLHKLLDLLAALPGDENNVIRKRIGDLRGLAGEAKLQDESKLFLDSVIKIHDSIVKIEEQQTRSTADSNALHQAIDDAATLRKNVYGSATNDRIGRLLDRVKDVANRVARVIGNRPRFKENTWLTRTLPRQLDPTELILEVVNDGDIDIYDVCLERVRVVGVEAEEHSNIIRHMKPRDGAYLHLQVKVADLEAEPPELDVEIKYVDFAQVRVGVPKRRFEIADVSKIPPIYTEAVITASDRQRGLYHGRQDEHDAIKESIEGGVQRDIRLLRGVPRVGKSSLLEQALDELPNDILHVILEAKDFENVPSNDSFWNRISDKVRRVAAVPEPDDTQRGDGLQNLMSLLQVVKMSGKVVMLAFDDIDIILKKLEEAGGSVSPTTWHDLRQLAFGRDKEALLVFASSETADELQISVGEDQTGTIFTILTQLPVSFLDDTATAAVVREPAEGRIDYLDSTVARIREQTGGFAWWIHCLCKRVQDDYLQKQGRAIATPYDVDRAAEAMLDERVKFSTTFWKRFLNRPEFLVHVEKLLGHQGTDEWAWLDPSEIGADATALKELVQFDVLVDRKQDGRVRFSSLMLRSWLDREVHAAAGKATPASATGESAADEPDPNNVSEGEVAVFVDYDGTIDYEMWEKPSDGEPKLVRRLLHREISDRRRLIHSLFAQVKEIGAVNRIYSICAYQMATANHEVLTTFEDYGLRIVMGISPDKKESVDKRMEREMGGLLTSSLVTFVIVDGNGDRDFTSLADAFLRKNDNTRLYLFTEEKTGTDRDAWFKGEKRKWVIMEEAWSGRLEIRYYNRAKLSAKQH